jgi:uncharacterized membrane protein YidH (DUF202 family)
MLDDALLYIKQDPTIVQTYSQESQSSTSGNNDYIGMLLLIFFFSVSGFGRWMTVPSLTGKGRKMKKYGRWMYAGVGLILAFFLSSIIASFILAFFASYLSLLI